MRVAALLLTLCFHFQAFAFETLNYDCAYEAIPDSAIQLNTETNRRIQKVILELDSCDVRLLEKALAQMIADPWFNNLEVWADEKISQCKVPAGKSVYRDFDFFDSPIGLMAGLKGVINIGGTHLGTDKLSHFMTEGYQYHRKVQANGSLKSILEQGIAEEKGIYGLLTTGIYSHADMVANFEGYRFWSQLTAGDYPYLVCIANKWQQRREFDWREYVDASFDESINCNAYQTESMEKAVDRRTAELQSSKSAPVSVCPLKPALCATLETKYQSGTLFEVLLSPRCRKSAAATEQL